MRTRCCIPPSDCTLHLPTHRILFFSPRLCTLLKLKALYIRIYSIFLCIAMVDFYVCIYLENAFSILYADTWSQTRIHSIAHKWVDCVHCSRKGLINTLFIMLVGLPERKQKLWESWDKRHVEKVERKGKARGFFKKTRVCGWCEQDFKFWLGILRTLSCIINKILIVKQFYCWYCDADFFQVKLLFLTFLSDFLLFWYLFF